MEIERDNTEPMPKTGDNLKATKVAREMYPEATRGLHVVAVDFGEGMTTLHFARVEGIFSKGPRKGRVRWSKSRLTLTVPDSKEPTHD